ncbi:MAG: MASE3 domain-containing protein [Bacillota bacterium]
MAGYILAKLTSPTLWARYTTLCHTSLELICIFIAVSSFLTVWHTYDRNPPVNHVIGFGFLVVALFDLFHTYYFTYYFPGYNLYPPGYYDLSVRYWILGRFAEAVTLLICTARPLHLRINKWAGLLFSTALAAGAGYTVLNFRGLMPVMFTGDGLTPVKIVLEYVIIALFLTGLFQLKDKVNSRDMLTYRYIFLALLIAIPAELCFTMYENITSFSNTLGHILKITYYYYLFRGIFVSAVNYPYKKLEEAGKYTANILNGLPIGLATYDNNFRLSFINKKAQNLFGLKEEEMLGLPVEEVCAKIYGTENIEEPLVRQVSRTPEAVKNRIITIANENNPGLKLQIEARQLETDGFLLLITEAKKEQQLENLQLQTQTILNSISNLVVLVNQKNNIIMCNRAFSDAVEMDAGHIPGRNLEELYRLLQFKKKEESPKGIPGEEINKAFEVSFITAKGNRKELVLQSAPISNVDGEVIGGIVVASDITALKKEQQKLQQREKLALLGEMAAGVVHEIKNPLTTIKGFGRLIASKAGDKIIRDYACIIESTANDVNKVVSDFLAFAKPRPPVLKPISLNDLIQSMRLMLESHLFIKGVDFNFIPSTEEKTVMADESQIKQVILNMIENAIEAVDGCQNPRLAITTGLTDTKDEMFITISDNGKGMPLEHKLKVGTPFFTTKDKGTGLCLSICYQIVNEHGGRIGAESEPGKGTAFTISLPCKMTGKQHKTHTTQPYTGSPTVSQGLAL